MSGELFRLMPEANLKKKNKQIVTEYVSKILCFLLIELCCQLFDKLTTKQFRRNPSERTKRIYIYIFYYAYLYCLPVSVFSSIYVP